MKPHTLLYCSAVSTQQFSSDRPFSQVKFPQNNSCFFRVLSSPRGVSDFVIMARNSQQSDELGELILRDGSDLEYNFSDSSVEEDFSDESD